MSFVKEYDDSPPRNGVIFFYTVLTVFVLIGVKFLLDSYFEKTMDAEVHDKVLTRGMEEVAAMREHERTVLGGDKMQAAKLELSRRGRMGVPSVKPASGQGMPEVKGWTLLGRDVAEPKAAAPEGPAADVPASANPEPGQQPEEQ